MYLLYALIFSLTFNLALFAVAFIKQTDKLTDASYSLTFLALVAYTLAASENNWSWLVSVLVASWAVRLGVYLAIRIHNSGKDSRFDNIRGSFWKFAGFWVLQGVTVWVVCLGVLTAAQESTSPNGAVFVVGAVTAVAGLIIESVADYQKYRFIKNRKNQKKWIESGLWKFSRHPNYFGEILVWLGVFVAVSTAVSGYSLLLALLSPVYITSMLLFVSGVPMLEKSAEKKWGNNSDYQDYKRRTSLIVPLPSKESN